MVAGRIQSRMTIIQHSRNEVYLVYGWTNERREAAVSFQRVCFHDSGNEVESKTKGRRVMRSGADASSNYPQGEWG